jgi:glycosyltransferase involved in cell wall biosynthesis
VADPEPDRTAPVSGTGTAALEALSGRRLDLVLATSTGGVGQHVRSLVDGFVPTGVEVVVHGPAATDGLFEFTAAGARFEPVEIAAGPSPRADRAAVAALRRSLDPGLAGPQGSRLVHAHGLRAGLVAGLALGRRRPGRTPLVVTWHNAVLGGPARRRVYAGVERVVARRADVTLGASEDLVRRAGSLGAGDARLGPVAAPELGPPSSSRADTRSALGLADEPLVLAVGRLHPQKDFGTLVDAAVRWQHRSPAPRVAIAGDGPQRADLERRIAAARAPVTLLGRRTDIADLLAASDVVVLTSRWEARALVAQEALRAGRPLVATAVGGLPGLVGDAALLVPPRDPASVAAAVERLLDEPELAARLVAHGLDRSRTWPDVDGMREALGQIYLELLEPR